MRKALTGGALFAFLALGDFRRCRRTRRIEREVLVGSASRRAAL